MPKNEIIATPVKVDEGYGKIIDLKGQAIAQILYEAGKMDKQINCLRYIARCINQHEKLIVLLVFMLDKARLCSCELCPFHKKQAEQLLAEEKNA